MRAWPKKWDIKCLIRPKNLIVINRRIVTHRANCSQLSQSLVVARRAIDLLSVVEDLAGWFVSRASNSKFGEFDVVTSNSVNDEHLGNAHLVGGQGASLQRLIY